MEQQTNQPGQPSQFNYPPMNPINSAPVIPSPISAQPQEKKSGMWPVIIAIIITAVIVGGGIYWWSFQKEAKLNAEIINLQNQISQLTNQLSTQTSAIEKLNDELLEAKFRFEALSFSRIEDILRDPQDKNKFYYIRPSGSDVSEIIAYDLVKDVGYQQAGDIDITAGSSLLLGEKVGKLQEFRNIGILDNKLIFTKIGTDYSPNSCFSPWLYPNLSYIDLGVSSSTKQSYVLPEDLKNSEMQKEQQCQNALNS
jgi:hypothetical protein